jgi:phenylalanyl-tRNA synthetase beta chain
MGGASSEVHDATTRLLLESALFDPTRIRRTAKRLGLHSEASHRFERGVDPSTVVVASRRCAQLLADWAGARPAGALLDVQTRPGLEVPVTVAFRPARTSALLGVEVPAAEQAALLSRLHLSVQMDREPWQVSVPTARRDLTREVDLIEEVARVWGYDRIPSTVPRLEALPTQAGDRLGDALREAARGLGFEEVITYGFVGPRQLQALGLSSDDPRSHPVLLENPLREELSALRTTLVPGLVQVLLGNVSRQVTDLCVFELGVAFLPRGAGEAPSEERHLVGLLSGTESGWLRRGAPLDVFDATGALEECLGAIGARFVLAPSSEPWLHPGKQAAIVVDGVARGFVGELHPDYRQRAGLELPAFVFEVNVEGLSVRPVEARTALPRFPAVVRDLSFFVDESVPAAQIRRVVEEAREPLVAELAVLEDYREPGRVPPGKKGMLWTLTYRAPDRTLTDDEVTAAQGRLQARLTAELAIQLRV